MVSICGIPFNSSADCEKFLVDDEDTTKMSRTKKDCGLDRFERFCFGAEKVQQKSAETAESHLGQNWLAVLFLPVQVQNPLPSFQRRRLFAEVFRWQWV